MSTPNNTFPSKPAPRVGAALSPPAAVSTPGRSVPSPAAAAQLGAAASSRNVTRSPWKGSSHHTPVSSSLNAYTPTPSGQQPPGSSPPGVGDNLGPLAGVRARTGTNGTKSNAGSPAAMNTPAAFSGLGLTVTPSIGGLVGASQLNGSTMLDGLGLVGRDAEAWMAQRTREVVDILGTHWGKVSQENIKRCVERIGGLECYWEDHPGGKEKVGERKRTLVVAGNEMMLEIGWLGERVTRVVLNFMRPDGEVTDDLGADILRQDLMGKSVGYVEAHAFVENLSKLARIDQLGRGKVSCFEALQGLESSMKKLWELELAKEKETNSKVKVAEIKTLCERSGRPVTHSDNKLGLRLEFWIDKKVMAEHDQQLVKDLGDSTPFNLLIDCEAFNADQYPPIRISRSWLSASVADAISDPTLQIWDDPSLTFIPGTQPDAGAMDLGIQAGTQPDVRFVARLDPPITVPLDAAIEILEHMRQPLTQDAIQTTTYMGLLFPAIMGVQDGTKDGKVFFTKSVTAWDPQGLKSETQQRFDVYIQTHSWARTLNDLPFYHPRQLVDVLPYLRQWAFFGRFLQRSFGDSSLIASMKQGNGLDTTTSTRKPPARPTRPKHNYQHYEPPSDTDSDDEDEPAPKAQNNGSIADPGPPSKTEFVIETSFTYASIPRRIDMAISAKLPRPNGQIVDCNFSLKIHPNARLEVENNLVLSGADSESLVDTDVKIEKIRRKLERVLRIAEDLGDAIAWLHHLTSPSTAK